MKRMIALALAVVLMGLLCACREEPELEPWQMPTVDTPPTSVPTAIPTFGGGSPERYVWNEAVLFNMSAPGAAPESVSQKMTHRRTQALFPYTFLPEALFSSSYASYGKLTLQKQDHEVLLDGTGALAEHAWVEYVYLPANKREDEALYVMAELCPYEAAREIYSGVYPHLSMPEGERLRLSTWYWKEFILAKVGEQRVAMLMKLTPSSYFSDSARSLADDAAFVPARQVFLTVTCGVKMSDEQFIAAVTALLGYSDGSEIVTPEPSRLPVFGERGAA